MIKLYNKTNKSYFNEILDIIFKFSIRQSICGSLSNKIERDYGNFARKIFFSLDSPVDEEVIRNIKTCINQKMDADSSVRSNILEIGYKKNKSATRLVLKYINKTIDSCPDINECDLDHAIAQSCMDGRHLYIKHNIGNLALAPRINGQKNPNKVISNKPFPDKKELYYKYSSLKWTKDLSEMPDNWGSDEDILARAQRIGEELLRIGL